MSNPSLFLKELKAARAELKGVESTMDHLYNLANRTNFGKDHSKIQLEARSKTSLSSDSIQDAIQDMNVLIEKIESSLNSKEE